MRCKRCGRLMVGNGGLAVCVDCLRDEFETPKPNRAERRRVERAGPTASPRTESTMEPITPALATAEVGRLMQTEEMIRWRVVELWLTVAWHFGPSAWSWPS